MEPQEAVPERSFLLWLVESLGSYAALLPLAALVAFVLALVLVIRGRSPHTGPALVLIVLAPILLGFFAALQGMLITYTVIAASEIAPKPRDLAEGISMALVAPLIALLLSAPAYAVATIGLFARAIFQFDPAAVTPASMEK